MNLCEDPKASALLYHKPQAPLPKENVGVQPGKHTETSSLLESDPQTSAESSQHSGS